MLYLQQNHFKYFSLHNQFTHIAKVIVGKRIRMLRKQNNMTLRQLPDEIKVDRQYVWNIKNGEVNLKLDYIDILQSATSQR